MELLVHVICNCLLKGRGEICYARSMSVIAFYVCSDNLEFLSIVPLLLRIGHQFLSHFWTEMATEVKFWSIDVMSPDVLYVIKVSWSVLLVVLLWWLERIPIKGLFGVFRRCHGDGNVLNMHAKNKMKCVADVPVICGRTYSSVTNKPFCLGAIDALASDNVTTRLHTSHYYLFLSTNLERRYWRRGRDFFCLIW
jgi:hypothetical protein